MREIRTSGLMSGDVETERSSVATAPVLDSTTLMTPSGRDARGPEDYARLFCAFQNCSRLAIRAGLKWQSACSRA